MKYTARPYQSRNDLYQIGKLLRNAYARQRCLNAWSFCRYDIWALRRIADAESFNDHSWQEYFQLLHDENGVLVGAAFAFDNHHWRKNPEPYALILDPEHAHLAKFLFDWAESSGMFEVEILESNEFLTDLIQSRGYNRSNDSMIVREKILTDTPAETVILPPGYSIRTMDCSEWMSYFEAVTLASIQQAPSQAPSNIHGIHLNVVNEQDQIAAFCSVWLDHENSIAEFEPVGTVPQFQKQGLGVALLAYACNCLREMGYPKITVESWSDSIGANKLYSACGLLEQDRLYSWKKDGDI